MQMLKLKSTFAFMSYRLPAMILSALLVLASIGMLSVKGLSWGIDFTGGTLVQVRFDDSADLQKVRQLTQDNGYADAIVSTFGSSKDVLIRLAPRENVQAVQIGDSIIELLNDNMGVPVYKERIEFVGPSVGDELKEQGGLVEMANLYDWPFFALLVGLISQISGLHPETSAGMGWWARRVT